MSGNPEQCPVCGTVMSGWLEGNCPTCLMQLGTPPPLPEEPSADSMPKEAPKHLGDYELLEEIARGGMGVVYRARQVSLKRMVAMKVLLAAEFGSELSRKRFRREAEAAASLSHPNIVSIYEVGEHEGLPYFSMQLIEGRSLADLTRTQPVGARQAAEWLKILAETVQFAHERKILHRDLKPSNVLVDSHNAPYITDFGLAKGGAPGADLTLAGQVIGTPSYMPPEQANPKGREATPASDVYSLGAILYHLLTARPPFMAETLTQTLRSVAETEPVSPRLLNPSVPRDLETICLKCLDKEPKRRYATGSELAEELGRFLRNEPIRSRPIGLLAKLTKWCRRKPTLALTSGAVVLLLLLLAMGSIIAVVRINHALELAEAAKNQTRKQLFAALLEQARGTVRSGELGQRVRTLDAVRQAAAITNAAELRREAWAALALPDLRFERELPTGSQFTMVQLDPLFERIARCQDDGPVEIRSAVDGRLLKTLESSGGSTYWGIWSPDGRFFAVRRKTASADQGVSLEVWDVESARRVVLELNSAYRAITFHPHFPHLLAMGPQSSAMIWDLIEGKILARLSLEIPARERRPSLAADSVRFSPDGERFAAAYEGGTSPIVSIHRSSDGSLLLSVNLTNRVADIAWEPNGDGIAAVDMGGLVYLIDSKTGQFRVLGRHRDTAATAMFSPDGSYLFTGGYERELICWDLHRRERAFLLPLDSFLIQFQSAGSQCAVITKTACQIYTFEQPVALHELSQELHGANRSVTFSPDNRWLAATDQERVGVWDAAGMGAVAWSSNKHGARLVFSARGELFASGSGSPGRWQVLSGLSPGSPPILKELPLPETEEVTSLWQVADALAVTSTQGSKLIPIDRPAPAQTPWSSTPAGLNGASPDERWLAMFVPYGNLLYIYALPSLQEVVQLTNQMPIKKFEFSPLSDELAVATRNQVEIWSCATWGRIEVLTNCLDLLFAPGHRGWWLTTDSRSGSLCVPHSRILLLPLPTGTLPAAISPDGRFLAVSVNARRLQVWDLVEVQQRFRELGISWE